MNRIAIKPNVMEQVFAVARRSALFAAVPDEYLEKMLCQSPQRLADGECVFQQGDKADRFYLVIEGQIKLHRRLENQWAWSFELLEVNGQKGFSGKRR